MKLDCYDLSAIINGLYSMKDHYDSETHTQICDLILRLIDIHDNMNPKRKVRINLDSVEHRIILRCLIDWRNQFLQEGKPSAAEGVGELILLLCI